MFVTSAVKHRNWQKEIDRFGFNIRHEIKKVEHCYQLIIFQKDVCGIKVTTLIKCWRK